MRAILLAVLLAPLAGCAVPAWLEEDASPPAPACARVVPLPAAIAPAAGDPVPPVAPPGWQPSFTRDAFGVPHIVAGTLEEAARQTGYATAEDRLWQMEILRRASSGRLAELLGEDGLASDRVVRTIGYTPEERAGALATLDAGTLTNVRAYLEGVNARIAAVSRDPGALPAEFAALGVAPLPWTMDDFAALATMFFVIGNFDAGSEAEAAGVYAALVRSLGEERAQAAFDDLVPAGAPGAPTTAPPDLLSYPREARPPRVPEAQRALVLAAEGILREAATRPDEATLALPRLGSNWVLVAPELSQSGGALILGGPQTGYDTPNTFWEVVADVDGVRWHTLQVPGLGAGVGRLGSATLSITVGYGDQTDLVVVELDGPDAYRRGGETRAFETRTERILVADRTVAAGGLADPASLLGVPSRPPGVVEHVVRRAEGGNVVAYDEQAGLAVIARRAQRWEEIAIVDAFYDPRALDASRDPASARAYFDEVARRVPTSMNFALAYEDGVIEWRHLGRVPVRDPAFDRRLPAPAGAEWAGVWDPSCMPFVRDPPQGWLANWNNVPAEGWPNIAPYPWMWGGEHRVATLQDALGRALDEGPLTLDRLSDVNREAALRDNHAYAIVPALLDLAPDSAASRAIRAWGEAGFPLRDDDGDGAVDHEGVAAYEAFRAALQARVFGDELGELDHELAWARPIQGENNDDHGTSTWGEGVLLALVDGSARHDWWDDARTPARETAQEQVSAALAAAEGAVGRREMTRIELRSLGAGPALSMPAMNRGTINFLHDTATGEMWTVVPPGQSGQASLAGLAGVQADPHVDDQLALFEAFEHKQYGPDG